MSDSNRYGPDNQGSNQYKYSYGSGSGRGTTPPGGYKPPKKNEDVGEWIGIGLMLFILPFWFCKLIGVVWLIRKLVNMSNSGQSSRYQREARDAAKRARDTVVNDIFGQTFGQDFSASGSRGQQDAAQPGAAGTSGTDSGAQTQSTQKTADYQYGRQSDYQYGRQSSGGQQKKQAQPKAEPWEVKDPAEERKRSRRLSKLKAGGGKGLIIAGGIVSGIFALGSTAIFIDVLRSIVGGYFWPEDIIGLLACLMFLGGGLAMLFSGIGKGRTNERYLNYLAYIGANREVSLAPMAASFGVSVGKLCKDLRRMLAKGILPTGYLDLAEGKLFLTEMGYRAPEPKWEAPPVQEETPQQAAAREDDILREIRQVNDEIPDEAMSAKINRIEEITRKILNYQKSHPNKEGQLRTFLNYYLPTTLKILRAYAQLDAQGIEGENISAAKKRIEDMMDQVVYGFEKQLDKLFQDDAMDITSDVEVLENMLKKDGLSDEGGITMTL